VILKVVYFQYVPHLSMLLTGLHNLGTIPPEAEKSEGSRLSTGVEKPVENPKTALEADWKHREPYRSRIFNYLSERMGCG
jgi:hypothetical protein